MLAGRPAIAVVVDIDLSAIAIRVLIIEGRLRSAVGGQRRDDAKALEPSIGAKQFIDGPILEGDVLQPMVARQVGIGGEAGQLDKREAMIGLVIADPCSLERWRIFLATRCRFGLMHDRHTQHLSIPVDHDP